jgi:hypothetical protein
VQQQLAAYAFGHLPTARRRRTARQIQAPVYDHVFKVELRKLMRPHGGARLKPIESYEGEMF